MYKRQIDKREKFYRRELGKDREEAAPHRLPPREGVEKVRRLTEQEMSVLRKAVRKDIDSRTEADRLEARIACTNLVNLFDASLRLLHPVMPFITEEIWQAMHEGKPALKSIALAPYPRADEKQFDFSAETEMAILQDLIVNIRNLRAELKVEPKIKVPIEVFAHEAEIQKLIEENRNSVLSDRTANVEKITFVEHSLAKVPGARSTARFDVHVVYERKIDVASECERLKKELERIEKGIGNGQKQLGNQQFRDKAPQSVVENLRKQQVELAVMKEKTVSKLKELGCG